MRVDVPADQDLNGIASGTELRHLYRMVVFESHGEYVTSHMFDITEQYRNLGGRLAFRSANDFFREVVISGDSMTLIGRFRDLGRPEAALIGAQYIEWYRNRYPNRPYRVVGAGRVPWLFARTGRRGGRGSVDLDPVVARKYSTREQSISAAQRPTRTSPGCSLTSGPICRASTSPLPARPTSGSCARGQGSTGMTGVRELSAVIQAPA
jgi:N,N-dimethylformamidase beta subunit-like, C-terminal